MAGLRCPMTVEHRHQRRVTLALGLVVCAFIAHSLATSFVVDDAYIGFRYAQQLLRGDGLVYNPGERVEGYTNFLWVVLIAAISWALPALDLLTIARGLGIGLGAICVLWLARLARRLGARGAWCLLAPALVAFNDSFAAWSTSGLETVAFAFFTLAGVAMYLAWLESRRGLAIASLAFACACMTRPDGLLLFGLTAIHLAAREALRTRKLPWREAMTWAFPFLAVYGTYFIWRWSYYGYPFPNTFYVKEGGADLLPMGFVYVRDYFISHGAFLVIPIPWLLATRCDERRSLLAMLIVGYLAFIAWAGGDGLGFFRFVSHIMPLLALLIADAWHALDASIESRCRPNRRVAYRALALVCVLVASIMGARKTVGVLLFPAAYRWTEPQSGLSFPTAPGTSAAYTWFDNYFVERQARAGRWLDRHLQPSSLVASTPAGAIAYHMQHRVLDMLGLNDLHIARTAPGNVGFYRPGHMKGDGKYVLERRPDVILMGNVAVLPEPLSATNLPSQLVRKSEHEIWSDPGFHARYDLVVVRLAPSGPFQYFSFFLRKDVELPTDALAGGGSRQPSPGITPP